jgi:GntR family transcriptional regulator / MocR family aminotransferase
MPVQWTGLGPELLVPLDRDGPDLLRTQLERGLREAIRTGRLRPGERLPSTRELARELGVSRGMVVDCFDQLQAEGYLVARGGSATWVADTARSPAAPPPRPAGAPVRLRVDFRPAVPDLSSFPRADWARTVAEVCRSAANAAFDYGDPRGAEVLRTVLASYLGRVRGAAADADRIVVCTGFSQGLNLALATLAGRGVARVAFEDPGYDETGRIAAAFAGVEVVRVPVDEEGLRVDALAASGAGAVVVTPAHQWPTGVVLSPARRRALTDWATRTGGWVVEDDYDAEFRYDREPVGAVQGLAPDQVITIGTVSKSLAPSLRLGWLVCPASLVGAIADGKVRTDRGSPGLDQLVLARFLEAGRFDRHLRRMRRVYSARREVLVRTLATVAPAVTLTGLAAGFHAVAGLPPGLAEADVVEGARARGIGLYGMSTQRATGDPEPPQLVLGFGNLTEPAIHTGLHHLADLLRDGVSVGEWDALEG